MQPTKLWPFNQERDWRSNLQNGEAAYRIMFCHAYVSVQTPADLFFSLRMMELHHVLGLSELLKVFFHVICPYCSCNLPKMHGIYCYVFFIFGCSLDQPVESSIFFGWFPHENALLKNHHIISNFTKFHKKNPQKLTYNIIVHSISWLTP